MATESAQNGSVQLIDRRPNRLCRNLAGGRGVGATADFDLAVHETWLKPNRRAIAFACVPPLILGAIGLGMAIAAWHADRYLWRAMGAILLLAALTLIGLLMRQMLRPRIAYRDGRVLFYLRFGPPFDVPAQFVEAFFLGQGPAELPAPIARREETVNLVARLSQRQIEWADQTVKPALGHWSDGYVTIRGTWCEPLDADMIRRLNRRLKEVNTKGDCPDFAQSAEQNATGTIRSGMVPFSDAEPRHA